MNYRFALIGCVCVLASLATSACDFNFGEGTASRQTLSGSGSEAPPVEATPELSSLFLFGSALLGAAGFFKRSASSGAR